MTVVKTLLVVFPDVLLRSGDIRRFRSFLNQQNGWQDALFHNHAERSNSVIYRYPRIQYRVKRGKAALFAIQEGVDALQNFLNRYLDNLPEAFWTVERLEQRTRIQLMEAPQTYTIHQWLGLNSIRNQDGSMLNLEQIWRELTTEEDRKAMLQRILTAQLLKFCGEMECRLPKGQLQVQLQEIKDLGVRTLSSQTGQTQQRAFQLLYTTNLHLPDFVAFGKGVSKGFGWQEKDKPR